MPASFNSVPSNEKGVDASVLKGSASYHSADSDLLSINEKALIWKIDMHVVPWLALLYLFNFLDRASIGNAKV